MQLRFMENLNGHVLGPFDHCAPLWPVLNVLGGCVPLRSPVVLGRSAPTLPDLGWQCWRYRLLPGPMIATNYQITCLHRRLLVHILGRCLSNKCVRYLGTSIALGENIVAQSSSVHTTHCSCSVNVARLCLRDCAFLEHLNVML